jgi:hypothetical protein
VYDDTLPFGSTLETGAEDLQDDLNAIRSQIRRVIFGTGPGNWYDNPIDGGIDYFAFLLDNEPIAETGAIDANFTVTYSGIKVIQEEWRRNDTTLIKTIDYTYTGIKVTQEVRKVFAADGTTVVAQVTWTYAYTGILLTSGTMTRDV